MDCILAAAVSAAAAFAPAHATEGAVGRPITGLQAASYSGLIPPTPGWNMQIGYAHYSGDIGGEREIPIGGVSSVGLDRHVRHAHLHRPVHLGHR